MPTLKTILMMVFLLDHHMEDFLPDFTHIVEANARIYWSIILSIVLSLILFVIEAVHVQYLFKILNTSDQILVTQMIDPATTMDVWLRILIAVATVFWFNDPYLHTKKKPGLFAVK